MFDITIGKVSSLWNFTGDDPKVPEQADLTEALKTVTTNRSISMTVP